MSNTLGVIFGFLLPNIFLNEKMDNEIYKSYCTTYLFWVMILSITLCFPILIFFKSKPEHPPR